jgi:putative ABC transport system permease protein
MHTLVVIAKLFRSAARIQRKRMTMTVAAIAWGTISIVLLLSFGEGLKRSMTEGWAGLGTGIAVIWPGETTKPYAGFPPGRDIRLVPEDVDLIDTAVEEITSATGEMRTNQQLVWGRASLNKQLLGVHVAYGELRNHRPRAGGRFLNEQDLKAKRRVIFLGDELAKDLFGDREPVGETVMVSQSPFVVVGVMQTKKQMGMYGGPDSNHAVIPLTTYQAMYSRRYLSNLVFKVDDPALMEVAKKRFNEVLGAKYKFDPEDERAMYVWDTVKTQTTGRNIMLGIEIFLGIIGGLTLLIGGVGVANIMYAVVKHRTREIAIQMAIGAKRAYIMGALVVEATFLTFIGGAIGIAVGFAIVQLLGYVQSQVQSDAMKFLGAPTFSLTVATTTVLLLGTLGLLAGYFPSRRAVSVHPAEALRYE